MNVIPQPPPDPLSLRALSFALRHPDVWPDDFTWNYSYNQCCALGLTRRLWPEQLPNGNDQAIFDAFHLSFGEATEIFYMVGGRVPHWDPTATTPNDVADAIDTYLANKV